MKMKNTTSCFNPLVVKAVIFSLQQIWCLFMQKRYKGRLSFQILADKLSCEPCLTGIALPPSRLHDLNHRLNHPQTIIFNQFGPNNYFHGMGYFGSSYCRLRRYSMLLYSILYLFSAVGSLMVFTRFPLKMYFFSHEFWQFSDGSIHVAR